MHKGFGQTGESPVGKPARVRRSKATKGMDEGARKWMIKTARKQYWRVAARMEFDDFVQVGYESFWYVRRHYPSAVDPPHIMRLFQLRYMSCIMQLHKDQHRSVEEISAYDATNQETHSYASAVSDREAVDMTFAPEPVRQVITRLAEDGSLLQGMYKLDNGVRETINERLCRIIGLDPRKIDLAGMVRKFLQGESVESTNTRMCLAAGVDPDIDLEAWTQRRNTNA